ncbi:MAG: ABC transporter ATP-binding protein [Candidatus Lokiarchaeota archaeon]|nr:ABC transporter ATP-binding protein [Candidatus Lokiarchaeota archaeon]
MKYCIETRNLIKEFDYNIALDGITFKIRNNRCVGYLGPNGSGKTTTMKILTNLINPSSGESYINEINVQENHRDALKNVGAIIEEPIPYPYFTPRKILMYFGELRGINKSDLNRRVKEVLTLVKLDNFIDKKIGKFSTGMRQRLNLAQALLADPEILILDEPTLGLDPRGMSDFRNIILEMKKNKTIFLSSHILFQIEMICDEIILINRGKILKHDSIQNIRKLIKLNKIQINISKPISKDILRELNALNYIFSVESANTMLLITYDNEKVELREIMKSFFELGLEMESFIPKEASLEEVYLKLTEKEDKND